MLVETELKRALIRLNKEIAEQPDRADEGYQQILLTATTLFPTCQKLIKRKTHSKDSNDILNIETFLLLLLFWNLPTI